MKTTLFSVLVFLVFTSCNWFDFGKKSNDPHSLGGSTNIPINTVGNTFANTAVIGTTAYHGNITVTDVTNGVTTVQFKAAIPSNIPALQSIKPKYKDANGNLVCVGKFKISDEGILDYNNKDHQPLVLVKYDANVGDKYTLDKSDGTQIVREVVRKSTTDDFYWGGMLIKTIDVEQSSNIPGVTKIIYYTNHKFGLVAVKVVMEDGTTPQLSLVPSQY